MYKILKHVSLNFLQIIISLSVPFHFHHTPHHFNTHISLLSSLVGITDALKNRNKINKKNYNLFGMPASDSKAVVLWTYQCHRRLKLLSGIEKWNTQPFMTLLYIEVLKKERVEVTPETFHSKLGVMTDFLVCIYIVSVCLLRLLTPLMKMAV